MTVTRPDDRVIILLFEVTGYKGFIPLRWRTKTIHNADGLPFRLNGHKLLEMTADDPITSETIKFPLTGA